MNDYHAFRGYEVGAYLDASITGGAQWVFYPDTKPLYRYIDCRYVEPSVGALSIGAPISVYGHRVYLVDYDVTRDALIVTQSRWQACVSRLTVPLSRWWVDLQIKMVKTWRIWTDNRRH